MIIDMGTLQITYKKEPDFIGSEYDVTGTVTVHYAWHVCQSINPVWVPIFPTCPTNTKPIPLYPTFPLEDGRIDAVNIAGDEYFDFSLPIPPTPCYIGWAITGTDTHGNPRMIDGPRCKYVTNPAPSYCACDYWWTGDPYNDCGQTRGYKMLDIDCGGWNTCADCYPKSADPWAGDWWVYDWRAWQHDPCRWSMYPSTASLANKSLDDHVCHLGLDGPHNRWYVQLSCQSDAGPCLLWRGYKYTGQTPAGIYTRDAGRQQRETFEIVEQP